MIKQIVSILENEKEPISIHDLSVKLNIEEKILREILVEYILKQVSWKNLLRHFTVESDFFIIAEKIKEFNENKKIRKWIRIFYKLRYPHI
jgi:hypothetical protein